MNESELRTFNKAYVPFTQYEQDPNLEVSYDLPYSSLDTSLIQVLMVFIISRNVHGYRPNVLVTVLVV